MGLICDLAASRLSILVDLLAEARHRLATGGVLFAQRAAALQRLAVPTSNRSVTIVAHA
jgi:hypothetical protein